MTESLTKRIGEALLVGCCFFAAGFMGGAVVIYDADQMRFGTTNNC